jgi:hypothetical protein
MIFIFGDSHARFNFAGLTQPHVNHSTNSITMHRVGRDQVLIGFEEGQNDKETVFVCAFGEIDCRCHIQRQIDAGREKEEVINELVSKFMQTCERSFKTFKKVVICAITPALRRSDYESVHGPITHEFPFVGTDEQRVEHTMLMNALLEKSCMKQGYAFLNVISDYQRPDGTLKYELSDQNSHILENSLILEKFDSLLSS